MLLDVRCRVFDPISRRPKIEVLQVEVPDGSGNSAAAMAQSIRPGCQVVGIAPSDDSPRPDEREGPKAEGEEDHEEPVEQPSARELAAAGIEAPRRRGRPPSAVA